MNDPSPPAILDNLLTIEPAAETFGLLFALLKRYPLSAEDQRRVDERLAVWPAELRRISIEPHELDQAIESTGWQFVRCLEIREYDLDTLSRDERPDAWGNVIQRLGDDEPFAQITGLLLAPQQPPLSAYSALRPADLETLATLPLLARLTQFQISLTDDRAKQALSTLLELADLGQLTHLSLSNVDAYVIPTLDRQMVETLPQLQHLSVSFTTIEIAAALAVAENLPTRLRSLVIADTPLHNAGLKRLLSNDWTQLAELRLPAVGITAHGVSQLGRLKCASKLQSLDLSRNRLGAGGISCLALLPLAELRRLDLWETSLLNKPEAGVNAAFGNWRRRQSFPALQSLDVCCGAISEAGVSELSACVFAANLTTLKLYSLSAAGLAAIFQGEFPQLQELDASLHAPDSAVPPAQVIFGGSRVLASLRRLSLEFLQLDEPWLPLLLDGRTAGRLSHLRLRHCELRGQFSAVAAGPHAPIQFLDVTANRLQEADLQQLALSGANRSVVALDLSNNLLPQAVATILAAPQQFQHLVCIDLRGCDIADGSAEQLANHPDLPSLAEINWQSPQE